MDQQNEETLLTTGRLRLRRLSAHDLERLVALDGDPEVMRYLSGGAATPRQVLAERVLPRFLLRDERRRYLGVWAVEGLEDGGFLGWVSLWPLSQETPAEVRLGYRLQRSAWGQGHATEAARALLDLAFAEGDLERVEATTFELNLASQRVLEKLGLRLARRYRPTQEELAASGSFDPGEAEPWDGDDLVYEVGRHTWLQAQG